MTRKNKNCEECNVNFNYEHNEQYPDKRKYCDNCSAKKKEEYKSKQPPEQPKTPNVIHPELKETIFEEQPKDYNKTQEEAPKAEIKAPTGEYQSLVYNKTLCANSYEVGSAGNRFKLYFENVDDLKAKLKELKDAGLINDELDRVKFNP